VGECANENLTTRTSGHLTVAHSRARAPFFVDRAPADLVGFEVDLINDVASGLGFTRSQISWQSVATRQLTSPTTSEFDVAIAQLAADETKTSVTFTDPYFVQTQVLIDRPDSVLNKVTRVAELKGALLGVVKGSSSEAYVTDVLGLESLAYPSTNVLKAALRDHHVNGIVVPDDEVNMILDTFNGDLNVVGQFPPDRRAATFRLAMPVGDPLVACVDQVLARMSSAGVLDALRAKWFADGVERIFKAD